MSPAPEQVSAGPISLSRVRLRLGVSFGEALVPVGLLLFFGAVAWTRILDTDEGGYAYAGKIALQGKLVYRDFFWPQMPVVPYLYGAWCSVAGDNWYSARALSAVLATGVGTLLYFEARRVTGTRAVALGVVTAFAASGLAFAWLTTVKTYAASTFLLFLGFVLARRAARTRTWLVVGAAVGLAVETRSFLVVALPVFVYAAWKSDTGRGRSLVMLLAGFVLALVPAGVLFAISPRQFWWDNIGYHTIRTSAGLVGDSHEKLHILENVVGYGLSEGGAAPQLLLLLLATLLGVVSVFVLARRVPLPFVVAFLVGAVGMLPTPTYLQYLSVTVPFLLLGIAEAAGEIRRALRVESPAALRMLSVWAAVALALYAGLAAPVAVTYLFRTRDQSIRSANAVTAAVNERTHSGELVLSMWSGYLFPSHARSLPGLENPSAPATGLHLSTAQARRHRLATIPDLLLAIRDRRVRLVVDRAWSWTPPGFGAAELEAAGYRLVGTPGAAGVYVLPGTG